MFLKFRKGRKAKLRPDYRGIPTMECPCGSDLLVMCFVYDQETVLPGMFLLDGACADCGALLTLKCPKDVDSHA